MNDKENWIDDRRLIAKRYLTGWFTFDVLTLLPSILDIYPACQAPSTEEQSSTVLDSAAILRTLRVFRLVKLLRLAREWRGQQRGQQQRQQRAAAARAAARTASLLT